MNTTRTTKTYELEQKETKSDFIFSVPLAVIKMTEKQNILQTPTILAYIAKGFKLGQYFPVHPYKWNEAKNRPEVSESKGRIMIWWLNIIFSTIYYIFLVIRCIQINKDPREKVSTQLRVLGVTIICTITPCNHILTILRKKDMQKFVVGCMDYFERFEEQYIKPESVSPKNIILCEKLLKMFYIGMVSNAMFLHVIANLNPHFPETLSSVIWFEPENNWHGYIFLRFVGSLYLVLVSYNFIGTTLVLAFIALTSGVSTIVVLVELSSKRCHVTKKKLRCMKESVRTFRILDILTKEANRLCEIQVAYLEIILIFTIIYFAYGSIRFTGMMSIVCGSVTFFNSITVAVLFGLLGEIHRQSEQLLDEWKSMKLVGKNKLQGLYVKSMKIMKISVLGMFIVDSSMALSLFQYMVESLVNLLIMEKP